MPVIGNRLYCKKHNEERIIELGGNSAKGSYKGVIFTESPEEVTAVEPKDESYYLDIINNGYTERTEDDFEEFRISGSTFN